MTGLIVSFQSGTNGTESEKAFAEAAEAAIRTLASASNIQIANCRLLVTASPRSKPSESILLDNQLVARGDIKPSTVNEYR